MKNSKLIFYGLVHSAGVFVYVLAIAWFFTNAQNFFDKATDFRTPLAMLMLFVASAAITGSLVLTKPILLYLNGLKKEAVKLFFYTLVFLFIFTLIALAVNLIK